MIMCDPNEHTLSVEERKVEERILSRIPQEWGKVIRCDKGWYPLIGELDTKLTKICPTYTLLQVKEKFGSLRYYFEIPHPPDMDENGRQKSEEKLDELYGERDEMFERMQNVVAEAERVSQCTCEQCGQPGELTRPYFYVKTLCQKCLDACEKKRMGEKTEK